MVPDGGLVKLCEGMSIWQSLAGTTGRLSVIFTSLVIDMPLRWVSDLDVDHFFLDVLWHGTYRLTNDHLRMTPDLVALRQPYLTLDYLYNKFDMVQRGLGHLHLSLKGLWALVLACVLGAVWATTTIGCPSLVLDGVHVVANYRDLPLHALQLLQPLRTIVFMRD